MRASGSALSVLGRFATRSSAAIALACLGQASGSVNFNAEAQPLRPRKKRLRSRLASATSDAAGLLADRYSTALTSHATRRQRYSDGAELASFTGLPTQIPGVRSQDARTCQHLQPPRRHAPQIADRRQVPRALPRHASLPPAPPLPPPPAALFSRPARFPFGALPMTS